MHVKCSPSAIEFHSRRYRCLGECHRCFSSHRAGWRRRWRRGRKETKAAGAGAWPMSIFLLLSCCALLYCWYGMVRYINKGPSRQRESVTFWKSKKKWKHLLGQFRHYSHHCTTSNLRNKVKHTLNVLKLKIINTSRILQVLAPCSFKFFPEFSLKVNNKKATRRKDWKFSICLLYLAPGDVKRLL